MGKNKETYFQESWLSDPKYSQWVQWAKLKFDYRCKLCKKENKLGSGGNAALKKHKLSEEHKTNVNNLKACRNFFSPRNATLFSPCNATSLNSDSSLLNYPGEATSHFENNISVFENTSLQSTQNKNSIMLSFTIK